MTDKLVIECGPANEQHKRLVIARLGSKQHTDRFDTDDAFKREKFRTRVVEKFRLPDDAHEWIDGEIQRVAEIEDSNGNLWTPNVIPLTEVNEKPVQWFWEPYLPEGAFSVLDSDPNEGKTTVLIDMAARHSSGNAMPPHNAPDGTYNSGNVLLLAGEDDLERTIKPRLREAGARMERAQFLRTVSIDGEDERLIQLPGDIPVIERVIVEKKISFLGIDVLSCFIESGLSMNDDAHMRKVTTPLANMLERTRCTALVLRHLNKKENFRSMYRGGGSVAIVAAARAAFAIAPHPDEPGVKVLAAVKHNLGPKPHSLTYEFEQHGGVSRIAWGGQTDLTAADVLHPAKWEGGGSKSDLARDIIADVLADGPRGSNELERACEVAGVSRATYWRARKSLGVKADKTDFDGQWLLSLPSTNGDATKGINDEF